MAAIQRTYHLAPSWTITPREISLGSVVASRTSPHKPLSASSLLTSMNTPVLEPVEERHCQGIVASGAKWNLGLLSTSIKLGVMGLNISLGSISTDGLEYACDSIVTRRFVPSQTYITTATKDPAVKGFLEAGGFGTSVYMITGVKTASNLTVHTIVQNQSQAGANATLGLPSVAGPGVSYSPTRDEQHIRTIEGPVVFAFEIEKIRVGMRGKMTHARFTAGATFKTNDNGAYYDISTKALI